MRYNDLLFLLTVLLIPLKSAFLSLPEELYYPVRLMPFPKNETGVVELLFKEYGNYTHILNLKDFLYVVSNRDELLKLDKVDWAVKSKYSSKSSCTEEGTCDRANINLVQFDIKMNLVWYCYAYQIRIKNVSQEESPTCQVPEKDIMQTNIGQWEGKRFTTSDFEHRTVLLTASEYTYVGIHYFGDKKMHVFKNIVTLVGGGANRKVTRLPLSYLKDPGEFIVSFQNKNSIFFLLLETDFSCGFYNFQLQTRLLRICDQDPGNNENYFSVLSKVNLNCKQHSRNSNIPSYLFEVADSAVWMPLTSQLVVSFSSRKNEAPSSVLCSYSIKAIEDAFDSDLKAGTYKPSYSKNTYKNTCNNLDTLLQDNSFLSNINIKSNTNPLRKEHLSNVSFYQELFGKISHIAYDESIWSDSTRRVILVLGIENPQQASVVTLSLGATICILEKFLTSENITTIEILREPIPLLCVGTSSRLFILSMDRCKDHSREQCVSVLNPYCGWSFKSNKCKFWTPETMGQMIIPPTNTCPTTTRYFKDRAESLHCVLFSATDPMKQIGSCTCTAISHNKVFTTILSNCKVNGGWGPFSDWSDCSVTCDSGTQTRARFCDNPSPQNGGLICKGDTIELRVCESNLKCIKKYDVIGQINLMSIWSPWSACSNTCGFGYKVRTRTCSFGNCVGDFSENKLCQLPICKNRVLSEWSPWSAFNHSQSSRKRLRIHCTDKHFSQPYSLDIKLIVRTNQSMNCVYGQCFDKYKVHDGELSDWSSWSSCSSLCGVGMARRSRQCFNGRCLGPTIDIKICNKKPCNTIWSCWSNWIGCSSVCETAKNRVRHRYCIESHSKTECVGEERQEKECNLILCQSIYTPWSMWSACNNDGVIVRNRKCKSERPCLFPLLQSRSCAQASTTAPALHSSIYMIVSGLIGLLSGVLVGAAICYIWWRCTMSVIEQTNSELLRLPFNPVDQYNSQYLNSPIDTGSMIQQPLSTSNAEIYYQHDLDAPYRNYSDSSYSPTRLNMPLPPIV